MTDERPGEPPKKIRLSGEHGYDPFADQPGWWELFAHTYPDVDRSQLFYLRYQDPASGCTYYQHRQTGRYYIHSVWRQGWFDAEHL